MERAVQRVLLPEQGAPRTKIRSGLDVAGGELWLCIVCIVLELSGRLGAWRCTCLGRRGTLCVEDTVKM